VVDAADMQGSSTARKGGKAESKVGAFFFVNYDYTKMFLESVLSVKKMVLVSYFNSDQVDP